MNTGIKPQNLDKIIHTLYTNNRVKEVILFGSRAVGNYRPASDIDVTIKGNELTLSDQAELTDKLEQLPIPQFIDLIRYNSLESKDLIEHINTHGIALRSATPHLQ